MRFIFPAAIVLLLLLVSCGTIFPTNTANVEVSAVVEVDGRQIEGASVWQVTVAQQMGGLGGMGGNWDQSSAGNAIILPIDAGLTLFLRVEGDPPFLCPNRAQEGSSRAVRLLYFEACEVVGPPGSFTYADTSSTRDGLPSFGEFGWWKGNVQPLYGNKDLPAKASDLARRGFRIISLSVRPTSKGLGASIAGTYPWISLLPRYDTPSGGHSWHNGTIYSNYFTTLVWQAGQNFR